MHKAKKRSLRCCYCCIEFLSGFLLLMLVTSAITLLRYFLEFYEPMPIYFGNKTNLLINVTTVPTPKSQSFGSTEMLPQTSAVTFKDSQHLTAPLTSSSPQSLISSVNSALLPQTSPTNHLQQQTSDRRKTDVPQVPTEKTSSLTFPPPFASVTQSSLLHRLTSSSKQRSPEQLLTLPVKQESPQQLSTSTEMTSQQLMTSSQQLISTMNRTLSQKPTSALEPTSVQQRTTVVKMSSSRAVTTVSPWQRTLSLDVVHSQKPFSGQTGENETIQYFKGSFSLVNEVYHPNYSDSTSDDFRKEALKLENMISNAFAESRLKQQYQYSSIMEMKPSPFRAYFLVRMSNGIQASRLSPNTVAQEMIQGYQKASGNGVLMDEESLQLEEYSGLCLLKPSSGSFLNGASGHWNDNETGTEEGFPWDVTVLKDRDPTCKGSMIAEKWVLSTSSCVASSNNVSLYSIRFGAEGKHAHGSELYSVAKIIRHSSKAQEDLVLIQLARAPPITRLVHPICLPDPTHIAPAGIKCESLGSKENGDTLKIALLLRAEPKVFDWTVMFLAGCGLSSSPTSLCAETDDLEMNTQMTAGTSLVCPGENEQLYLEGIIPHTIENQGKLQLKEQLATFTRVAPVVPWIQSQVLP